MSRISQENEEWEDEISALDISACIAEKAEETLAPLKEDLVDWLKRLFKVDITVENFMHCLDNGVLVSRLAEMVHRAAEDYYCAGKAKLSVPKYEFRYHKKAKPGTFFARDNVAFFLDWCRCFGVSETVLFESDGLVMHKQPREVILCLLEVARIAANYGIEPPGIVTLEKEIDEEIANEEKVEVSEINAVEVVDFDLKLNVNPDEMKGELERQEEQIEKNAAVKEGEKVCQKEEGDKENNNSLGKVSLDKEVYDLARAFGVKIRKVKDGRYIVEGKITIFVRVLRHHVMVRVGGGWDTLENFLSRHDATKIGRILVSKPVS